MLLIKASRPNLSTSRYSTGGNNSLLPFSNSSQVQESKYSQRKKNKEERERKAPYTDLWVWVPILSTPGKLSKVLTILQVYTLTYTTLGETYLPETTVNPQEDPGILNQSVALKLPPHCSEQPAPCFDGSGKGFMLSGCEGGKLLTGHEHSNPLSQSPVV